jgi:WD40 repeat protein
MPAVSQANDRHQADKYAPQLVIETGFHRAIIRQLIFTADGSGLISVGDDKTIRVWKISKGGRKIQMAHHWRGQIGHGRIGALFAAALSPPHDKKQQWLAVAGDLSRDKKYRGAIRLHNLSSGAVVAFLTGHEKVVNDLVFSPDGRWLASASKDTTILIWDLANLEAGVSRIAIKATFKLDDHKEPIYDLDWSAGPTKPRMASASDDGQVILWDTDPLGQGKKPRQLKVLPGHLPKARAVAFHPAGDELISAGQDKHLRRWEAASGQQLQPLAGKKVGKWLEGLSFAPGGDYFVAGSNDPRQKDDFGHTLRRATLYSYPDLDKRISLFAHDNAVVATAFHPNGRILATAGGDQKEIVLWDSMTGEILTTAIGGGRSIFAVGFSQATDVRHIYWGWTERFQSHNRLGPLEHGFDLVHFKSVDGISGQLLRAIEENKSISLEAVRSDSVSRHFDLLKIQYKDGRKNPESIHRNPTNGYQHSAFGLSPDGRYILSGGSGGVLVLYDADGNQRASLIGHENDIKSVAISRDSAWALSGGTDQVLHLWRLRDLMDPTVKELAPALSFFPTTDGEWIVWNQEGYFVSSPNGRGLIGYTINQGVDRLAKYVSIDQLFDTFHRRAKLRAELFVDQPKPGAKGDTLPAKALIAKGLPPRVTLARLDDESAAAQTVTLRAVVHEHGGGVGRLVWRHNHQVVKVVPPQDLQNEPLFGSDSGAVLKTDIQRLELDPGINTIEVEAFSAGNLIVSEPASMTMARGARSGGEEGFSAPVVTFDSAPNRAYLVSIGVNNYLNYSDLLWAVPDSLAVCDAFDKVTGTWLQSRILEKKTFHNDAANYSQVDAWFTYLHRQVQPEDLFILFLSGHGLSDNGRFIFVHGNYLHQPGRQRDDIITHETIQRWLVGIRARRCFVIIDACYSGSVLPDLSAAITAHLRIKDAVEKISHATGRVVIAASGPAEQSWEGYDGKSVFVHALLKAMKMADRVYGNDDGELRVMEVYQFVEDEVLRISRKAFGSDQMPYFFGMTRNFAIGRVNE